MSESKSEALKILAKVDKWNKSRKAALAPAKPKETAYYWQCTAIHKSKVSLERALRLVTAGDSVSPSPRREGASHAQS